MPAAPSERHSRSSSARGSASSGSSGSASRWRACRAASRAAAASRCSSKKGTTSSSAMRRRLAEMSPKTLTGAELQLDDGPARDSELFLVDGNNLAYRAFFALPEELATSEGFSTNALLDFTNMLFKLLADYTPERVEARLGIPPEKVPDFIALKGDPSDNIPGIPGIGDKTAGQLVAQYGSLEEVLEHVDELTPARAKAVREHADQARGAKVLATMRTDLELGCDPAQLVLSPPDRSTLKEMFRRFEFRNLLGRVDELDAAVPAAASLVPTGVTVPWREELSNSLLLSGATAGIAGDAERIAAAAGEEVVVSPRPERVEGDLVAHDAKALGVVEPVDDTMILAYLIDPGRAEYDLDDLAAEYGLELVPDPDAEEETARLVRHAAATLRLRELLLERVRERGAESLYRDIELPLTAVLAAMESAGVKVDTYRMGEITARLADRVEELEAKAYELAGEEFVLGSTQPVARILFEKLRLTPGRKGKTGYSTDSRVLRSIRGEHELVGVIEEWREYSKLLNTYLGPLPSMLGEDGRLHTTFNQTVAATGRLSTTNPNLQAIPIRTELGREIRSAFVAEPGHKLLSADYSQVELRILAHISGEPKLRESFERGEDIHTTTAAEVLGKDPATLTKDERNVAKMVNFGIIYGISSFGLSENLEIPREEAQAYIDAYLARFPHVPDFIQRTIEPAARAGYVTTLFGRRRPVPEIRASNRQTRSLGERLAVNSVMQGTAADIIKVAMISIHRRLRDEGRAARLVLQVHDELLLEVPEKELSDVRELVREEMVGAYELDPPLEVDVGAGDDWHDAKR